MEHFVEFLKNKQNVKPLKKEREFGGAKGLFVIKDGFDDPIEDFFTNNE